MIRLNGSIGAKLVDLCNYCSEESDRDAYSSLDVMRIPFTWFISRVTFIIFCASIIWGPILLMYISNSELAHEMKYEVSVLSMGLTILIVASATLWMVMIHDFLDSEIIFYKANKYKGGKKYAKKA